MKYLSRLSLFITIVLCGFGAVAQTLFETIKDEEEGKFLKGILTREQITSDTSFKWWATNSKYFKPKQNVVDALKSKKDSVNYILFVGTWCHDTQQLLPAYFKSMEAAGVADNDITIIGVDRQKKTIGNLHTLFNVPNVPTIIVMKHGKEMGRIEEFGKTSIVDTELAELLNSF